MPEWREVAVGDLGTIYDGPHATPTRLPEGPHFLNIASLKGGRLDLSLSDHLSEKDFKTWTRRVTPQTDDLLFSYETRLGEAALMPPDVRACLGRRMAILRPDGRVVEPRFLLYCYLGPRFQETVAERAIHGATVSRIGLADMPTWTVSIPSLQEQRAIAEVLGALDDKIAANDRVIEASSRLMLSVLSTAAGTTRLDSIARLEKESVRPDEMDDAVAHFSLPAFDDASVPETALATTIKSNKFRVKDPCVLMAKLNPRIPRVWNLLSPPMRMAVASTEFMVLAPTEVSTSALWAALGQPAVSAELSGMVTGTSGSHQRVKPAEAMHLHVSDPRTLSSEALALVDGVGRVAAERREESQKLATTRDELLPLLMSGRVRVKDAESTVAGVT